MLKFTKTETFWDDIPKKRQSQIKKDIIKIESEAQDKRDAVERLSIAHNEYFAQSIIVKYFTCKSCATALVEDFKRIIARHGK